MTVLFDTNVISEYRRPDLAPLAFRTWAQTIDLTAVSVSVISILEIEKGVLLAERRRRPETFVLREWLTNSVLPNFGSRSFVVDLAVARMAGLYMSSHGTDLADALIAATASVHSLTLVTRNTRDFEPLGIPLLNPWDPTPT